MSGQTTDSSIQAPVSNGRSIRLFHTNSRQPDEYIIIAHKKTVVILVPVHTQPPSQCFSYFSAPEYYFSCFCRCYVIKCSHNEVSDDRKNNNHHPQSKPIMTKGWANETIQRTFCHKNLSLYPKFPATYSSNRHFRQKKDIIDRQKIKSM